MEELLQKIKKAKLVGRGGAEFPTYKKWEMVRSALSDKKFVICNASEGEIGIYKDICILNNYPERVMDGIILALDFLEANEAYININKKYWKQVKQKFTPIINKYEILGYKINIFEEDPSYIGGEETALLNAIEGHRTEPRLKPPFPSEVGLHGHPTLIHNVETLYNISLVNDGLYKNNRFYCISGKVKKPGVHVLSENLTIAEILDKTGNTPKFNFFVQIGGSASGLVLNQDQIKNQRMIGAGSIDVYPISTPPRYMFDKWFDFYQKESCGKCTPCREGTFQLYKMVKEECESDLKSMLEIIELMETASFCALGRSIAIPVKSYIKNVLNYRKK